ncbi:MBL fold metallo-hydrolase [Neobacillus rhizophilus]|uniref:MBL fold metallo-hydrolase n=1 Tax=Neobacillus rhizophilus TaxID=2833579 RepID=UPI0027DAF7B6|nr:MBL fold metallo-hydrolase [Neobacillus rhizophilus]
MYILLDIKKDCSLVIPISIPEKLGGLKTVNFFLVKQGKSLSLIDAGYNSDSHWEALNLALNQNGLVLQDVTEIILTHHHIDHVGLVDRIVDTHPIPVYASPLSIPRLKRDNDFMEMRAEFFAKLYYEMGCGETGEKQIAYLKKALLRNKGKAMRAEITAIKDNAFLGFSILEVPGHSPDQLAFLNEQRKQLFAGDLLIEHISSNAIVEPDENGNRLPTIRQQIDSLNKCAAIHIDSVFPGHGAVIHNPKALIHKRLERIEEKSELILRYIQSGHSTANEIAQVLYKNTYNEQFSLVMSEIIGHLDYLEEKKKITMKKLQGICHYSVKQ